MATPMAAQLSPKLATIRRSRDLSISLPLLRTKGVVSTLIKDPPPGAPVPPILPPQDGYLLLDKAKFAASFAADMDEEKAAFMADSQVPWGVEALNGRIDEPAWKTTPSWYMVATDDKMIPRLPSG